MLNVSFSIQNLIFFLMVVTRVTCFIYIVPFFGMPNTPNRIKIGLGVFISFLIYRYVVPYEELQYSTLAGYAWLIFREAAAGLLIGLGANMCSSIVQFAGKIMDMEIGLSMVSLFDPITREQAGFTGTVYEYAVLLMMIASNMYQYFLRAFIDSYQLIPVGGVVFNMDSLLQSMLTFLGEFCLIGFRICLPVFSVMLLLNAVLGILAKIAPQMNMFSVGMQLKVLTGLAVLFLTSSMLPGVADMIFTEMKKMIVSFIGGLH